MHWGISRPLSNGLPHGFALIPGRIMEMAAKQRAVEKCILTDEEMLQTQMRKNNGDVDM
jgi:hypothetical protein